MSESPQRGSAAGKSTNVTNTPPANTASTLDHTDRFRLREELQRALDFVRSPIPWRESDPRTEREWLAEHGLREGDYATAMGPRWAAEISRLAVILHSRLKGWPVHRHCPDDESRMVWELFERFVRICDAHEQMALADMQKRPAPPNSLVADRMQTLHILGDVLKSTPAGFDRFKAAMRSVVESMLFGTSQTPGTILASPALSPNPYRTLRTILHDLFWLAARARSNNENVLALINPTTNKWDGAATDARRWAVQFDIPFTSYDPILTEAEQALQELLQVAAGNKAVPFSALDRRYIQLERRLEELAHSTTAANPPLVGETPAPRPATPSLLHEAKQLLAITERVMEAQNVARKLLPFAIFGPDFLTRSPSCAPIEAPAAEGEIAEGAAQIPEHFRNWLVAQYLGDPAPAPLLEGHSPVVLVKFADVADYLLAGGLDVMSNLDACARVGWIEDIYFEIERSSDSNAHVPARIAALNLPLGRHRFVAIRIEVTAARPVPFTTIDPLLPTIGPGPQNGAKPGRGKRRRGRPHRTGDDPIVRQENQLYYDWKASGLTVSEFLLARGKDPKKGAKIIDRARKRVEKPRN